jgi:hypothetical protein
MIREESKHNAAVWSIVRLLVTLAFVWVSVEYRAQRERKQDKQTKIGRRRAPVTKVQNCISLGRVMESEQTDGGTFLRCWMLCVFWMRKVLGAAEAENSDAERLSAGDKWYWCAAADELSWCWCCSDYFGRRREKRDGIHAAWAMGRRHWANQKHRALLNFASRSSFLQNDPMN